MKGETVKKYLFVLLILALLLTCTLALAEAVDAVPGGPELPTELLTKEILATMVGMVLVTGLLSQVIKLVFMKRASAEGIRIMVLVVAVAVALIGKLVLKLPFEVADIIIVPGNAALVWLATMKLYESTFGVANTPAGNGAPTNIH